MLHIKNGCMKPTISGERDVTNIINDKYMVAKVKNGCMKPLSVHMYEQIENTTWDTLNKTLLIPNTTQSKSTPQPHYEVHFNIICIMYLHKHFPHTFPDNKWNEFKQLQHFFYIRRLQKASHSSLYIKKYIQGCIMGADSSHLTQLII